MTIIILVELPSIEFFEPSEGYRDRDLGIDKNLEISVCPAYNIWARGPNTVYAPRGVHNMYILLLNIYVHTTYTYYYYKASVALRVHYYT